MSLRTRIALIASSAVAVAVLAIAVTVYVTARGRLVEEVDHSLTDRVTAARAATGIAEAMGLRVRVRSPFFDPRGFDVIYVQLTDTAGNVLVPPGQELTLPASPGGSAEVVMSEATVDDLHLRIANVDLGEELGTLQIARSLSEVDATLGSLALSLTLIGVLGIAGAAALGLFIARSSLRPIAQLTDAAENVAETKELAQRITVGRSDEVGRLAGAFNEMMEALESSREQQRRLVRDAGHELRTPLTALRTNIELLARAESLPEGERDAIHADLRDELAELTDLMNEVVEVAAEADVSEPDSTIPLGELAEEVVMRFRRRARQQLELDFEGPSTIRGRRSALERALGNLIDNATKFSPPDSTIGISVRGERVAVTDSGPGIAPDERSRVFDRFYRAPDARATAGSGLGLSIVKQVVESHGGSVFVEDAPSGGTTIGFDLSPDS